MKKNITSGPAVSLRRPLALRFYKWLHQQLICMKNIQIYLLLEGFEGMLKNRYKNKERIGV